MEDVVRRSRVRKIINGAEKDGFQQYMYTLDIETEVKNIKEGIKSGKRNKEGNHENINFLILISFVA